MLHLQGSCFCGVFIEEVLGVSSCSSHCCQVVQLHEATSELFSVDGSTLSIVSGPDSILYIFLQRRKGQVRGYLIYSRYSKGCL